MINYSYYNNNFKKTILLIHGWGVDSSYMESLKDFLIKDFNVLIIDLPGHGKSILEKEFTIEDYVENIHFIERGYEHLIRKLSELGADIRKIED